MGKPRKSLPPPRRHRGQAIEPRQPERAAEQINRGDEPADLPVFAKHVRQHDAMHQKRRRDAERNQVRQRIEFAPERAFRAAQPRHPAVEQIEDARQQNEREREFDLAEVVIARRIGLDDFRQRHKAAEQIARRQQVRQKINFQLAVVRIVGGGLGAMGSFITGFNQRRQSRFRRRPPGRRASP